MSGNLAELVNEAKEALTIPEVWRRLGLPGEPRMGVQKSPFRHDRKGASFSISARGKAFKDWADESVKGDAVNFVEFACGCSRGEAMLELVRLAGLEHRLDKPGRGHAAVKAPEPETRPAQTERGGWGFRGLPSLPSALPVTDARVEALANLRKLSPAGIRAALERGLLRFVQHWDKEGWMVLDGTLCNGQIRRLDGENWSRDLKGYTVPGSWANWPLGCVSAEPRVLLVEGAPDLLAAAQLIAERGRTDTAPVSVLGAAQRIHPGSLSAFAGREVTIVEQCDPPKRRHDGSVFYPGQEAAARWARELEGTAAGVTVWSLPERMAPGKDLNDWLVWREERRRKTIST